MSIVYTEVEKMGIDSRIDEYTVHQPYADDGTLTFGIEEDGNGERTLSQKISDDMLSLSLIKGRLSIYASSESSDVLDYQEEMGRLMVEGKDLALSKVFDVTTEDWTCVQPYNDGQAISVFVKGVVDKRTISYLGSDTKIVLPPIDEILHVYAKHETK